MKKFTQTGKKALSVFLAALMVMTAWVFVAPTEAEAIDAGKYYVEIKWELTNPDGNVSNDYTGYKSSYSKGTIGFSLFYKTNNGTGTEGEVYWSIGKNNSKCGQAKGSGASVTHSGGHIDKSKGDTFIEKATIPGFPTKIYALNYNSAWTSDGEYDIQSIKVKSYKTNSMVTLWEGTLKLNSTSQQKNCTLNSNHMFTDKTSNVTTSTTGGKWEFPYASEIIWGSSGNPSDVITPADSTTISRSVYSHCNDQYGVVLGKEPSYSFACTGDTTNKTGITAQDPTTGTTNSTYQIDVTNKALLSTKGQNKRKVTITASYTFGGKTLSTPTKSFNVIDPTNTITFNGNGGSITPTSYKVYYGESLDSQSTYDNNVSTYPKSGRRDGYTWIGMFDKAEGGNLMDPTTVLNDVKTYYAHWEVNKYVAIFWNRMHDEVIHIESDIPYGTDITSVGNEAAGKLPAEYDEYDEAYHYKFTGWNISLNNITANQVAIYPVYTKTKHTLTTSTVAANCAHGAGTEYKCTTCGYSRVESTGSPSGNHSWGATTVTKEPTCTATGEGYQTCTVCGAHNPVTVPAAGHSYKTEKKDATCTATGSIKYTCTKCGYTDTDTLPKTAHTMQAGATVAATCTSAAYTPYKCSSCSYNYNVYDASQPAIGHSWSTWTVSKAATNTADGEMKRTCSKNSAHVETVAIPKGDHAFSATPTSETPATCHSTGTQVFKCTKHTNCGVQITVTTAKTAHNFKTTISNADCTTAGSVVTKCQTSGCSETITTAIPATGHNYDSSSVTKEATCTTAGVRTYTCSKCGITKTESIPATGHKFVTIPATCIADGSKKCANCQYSETISKTGHTTGNWEIIKNATCAENGVRVKKCTSCGQIQSVETIAKLESHSFSDWSTYQDATCTSDRIEQCSCTVCGKTETRTVSGTKGHSWNSNFTIDFEATCKSAGVKSIHCSRCEAKKKITVIPQLSHNWNAGVESPKATCEADGVKTYTCASCGETKTEVVPKLGHNFVAGTPVAATCKSSGYIPYTCANGCGESYKVINGDSNIVHDWTFSTSKSGTTLTVTCKCKICGTTHTQTIDVAEGHNYKNATVTKQPTCKETGTVTIACDKAHDAGCTSTVTATLPVNPNAHSKIKTTVTNPTCTAAGKVTTVCEACGETVSSEQSIPAKGHSFSAAHTAYVAPTCQNEGSVTYTCTVSGCGATRTDTLPVNANAHSFKAGTTHQATCKTPEYTEYTCANGCGTSYNSYSGTTVRAHDWKTEIEQNGTTLKITCICQYADCKETHTETKTVFAGHNYSIVEEVKEATCNAEGELKIKCSDAGCDASITVAVPKNANAHNYLHIYTAPTCQSEGSVTDICSICNKALHETIVIAKLEHKWGEPAVTEPTCSKDGKRVYTCTTCPDGTTKETKEEVIPKLGHDWKLESSHSADCTHGAYDHYVCRRTGCKESYDVVKNGAKALGHSWGEWTIINPTNDKPGSATRTCANDLTHVETVEIPAGNHQFDTSRYTETTPATCIKKGSRTYTCVAHENCGVSITVETDLVQHSYNEGVRTEATCTERAYTTYTCTECGRIRVVFDETSTPLGHNYVHGKSTASCEKAGTVEVTCSRCNISTEVPAPALGHDFSVDQKTVPATCHSVGYVVKKCSRCEETNTEYQNELVAHTWSSWTITAEPNEATGTNGTQVRHCTNKGCTATEEAPIPAKIHNWVEATELATEATCTAAATKTYFCSGCDLCKKEDITQNATYIKTVGVPLEHKVAVDYNAPTCTEDGSYVARCILCGEKFVNETLAKTGHSFNTYRDYVPATCVEDGSVTYTCSNTGCGETQTQSLPVNPNAHKMVEDPENSEVATCTYAGYKAYKCANAGCEHRYMMQIEGPTPHTEGTWTVAKEATCSSNGYEVLECADCHAIMNTREIPATGSHAWETVTSTDAKPTCTEISYSYKKCSDCGKIDETSVDVKNATGHDFSVFVEKKDATAKESGYVIYKCSHSGCAETLKSVIPASGHSFKEEVKEEASCTADGEKTYTCTVHDGCEANYTEKIPALGHKAGKAEITPATCKAEGSVVVKCTVCEEALQSETLAKLPHTFNDTKKTVVPPTCKEKGSITYTCATEGCDATLVTTLDEVAHDYRLEKSVQPTCLESGYDVYVCSVEGCGASYNKVTTSAKGHSAVEDTARSVEATCSASGHKYFKCDSCSTDLYDYDVPATGMHNYSKTVKSDPTCESAGYTYTVCANDGCGSIKTGSVKAIDALGHDYSVDEGNGVVKCSRCDSKITVEKTVTDETGTHALSGKITKLSTCKEQGEIEYICQTHENCPKSHTETLPLAAHSANAESIEKTEPRCNADGTLTNGSIVVKCSVCGAQIGETITIPAAHSYKVVKVEKATCGSKGKVTERCETCGHERVTELEMNASAHEFKSLPSIKVDATCATDGYEVYDCKFCDAQKFVKTTDKLGHRHTETATKNATCTEEGYTRVICKDCGVILSETPIEKLEHTKHVVIVNPTCTAKGTITTKCSVCGKLLEDVVYIPENGHSWGEWTVITAGTCMNEGQRRRVCSVCGEKETISSGVGEHVYPEKGVVTPATCTTDGFTTYTCTVCKKHSIIKDYTPKLGHIYSADYKIVIEPTCHSTGAKAHYCARCGAYEPDHIQKYVEIPRLAHTYGEWVVVTEPTCDTNGVRVRTCTGCEEKDEGHTQTELIGKIGHNYGEWEITKKSTCVEEGSQRRYCDRCKTWEVQAIPKGGHNRVADYAVEATCTAPGKTAGSHCSLCGLVFVAQQEVPMKEHMDLNGDGRCEGCGKTMYSPSGETDSCLCHGTGFRAFLYKIVLIIWKIFKINKTCVCGAKHYE